MKDVTLADVTKLHYLKTNLKGEAMIVTILPATGENFTTAWQSLQDYYENTHLLMRSFYSNYIAILKMKAETAMELRRLYYVV